MSTQNISADFMRLQQGFSYEGEYTIQLVYLNTSYIVPSGVSVEKGRIHVPSGSFNYSAGGIQFYSTNDHFFFELLFIESICSGAGVFLWRNPKHIEKLK